MCYQTQILKPMCNVGSEPPKATDDPGGGGYIVYCILREEGGKRERHRMPTPVTDARRVLRGQDRLGRLGHRAIWKLDVASLPLQRTAVVRPVSRSSMEPRCGATV